MLKRINLTFVSYSFVANFVSYMRAKKLFKLVFISHCYHESHRGELFLKHSVYTVDKCMMMNFVHVARVISAWGGLQFCRPKSRGMPDAFLITPNFLGVSTPYF